MKKRRLLFSVVVLVTLLFAGWVWSGTTGKIAGRVVDRATGQPYYGANVLVVGTSMGAATDENGYFTILQVPPGMYSIQVRAMGYAPMTIADIQVRIDQTTTVNFDIVQEVIQGEVVKVVGKREAVKQDVATSVAAFSGSEVQQLAISTVNDVIQTQAGVGEGLVIRGGDPNQALFQIDGITLRDPRNNKPITGVALSAVQEIAIERGGFNAEYGQVRSGLINVVTKEGAKDRYSGIISVKASPPTAKHFGKSVYDKNSMWMRPYLDDAVCWTGTTNGAWDEYTRRQYPEFRGWNQVSQELLMDDNPNNDLSPIACQRLFKWEHRRKFELEPDYNIDAGFGGPVPFISKSLGDLRFFGSFQRNREMLLIPLTRDDYVENNWMFQLTSDITKSMKLSAVTLGGNFAAAVANEGDQIFLTNEFGPNDNRPYLLFYPTLFLRTPLDIAKVTAEQRAGRIFSDAWYSDGRVRHLGMALKLTHTLNAKTFYEAKLEHIMRRYLTGPMPPRDLTKKYEIVPGYYTDEAPFGFSPVPSGGIGGAINFFGGHTGEARDSSKISATTFRFDITSQVNFTNLVKAGLEIVYNDLNLLYGDVNTFTSRIVMVKEHYFPIRGAMYVQDKLETKGFILNAGLRLDYSNANTEWVKPDDPFDRSFFSSEYDPTRTYKTEKTKADVSLSPRLGISHPITENSKLYFNYGHFKQLPTYEEMLRVGRSAGGSMINYGDPTLPLAKTVSYELGYDHLLFGPNGILVQAAAFYNDITNEQSYTTYASADGKVGYTMANNHGYADIRGFELTLHRTAGWISGFANYTYQVNTYGFFGRNQVYQSISEQRRYDENTRLLYQGKPLPQPFARVSLVIQSPKSFGPTLLGARPLEEWVFNVMYNWKKGEYVTWNPMNKLDVFDNVETTDYHTLSMRISKTIPVKKMRVTFFAEVNNPFNWKRLSGASFYDGFDYIHYMNSLHLPKSKDYTNIPGHDRVGDYRKPGVAFQPIEQVGSTSEVKNPNPRVIYYENSTAKYMQYADGNWAEVEKNRMEKILDTKAYIDMPNQTYFNFLNPRQWFFGVRIAF